MAILQEIFREDIDNSGDTQEVVITPENFFERIKLAFSFLKYEGKYKILARVSKKWIAEHGVPFDKRRHLRVVK